MMVTVDKRTARDWIARFHAKQEHDINLRREDEMVNLAHLSSDLVLAFLTCLCESAPDEACRTQMMEAAAHGMTHAILDALLLTTPPSLQPTLTKAMN